MRYRKDRTIVSITPPSDTTVPWFDENTKAWKSYNNSTSAWESSNGGSSGGSSTLQNGITTITSNGGGVNLPIGTWTNLAGASDANALKITLPDVGTYLIVANIRVALPNNSAYCTTQFYNDTTATAVANSITMAGLNGNVNGIQMTAPMQAIVTTTSANNVIRVQGQSYTGVCVWAVDSNGYSDISYVKLESSGGSGTSTDEYVKASSSDTSAGYLDSKVDNTTIKIIGNKLVAQMLSGQTATIGELNFVHGVTSNIQTQINSLTSGMKWKGTVATYSALTAVVSPSNGDAYVVTADENHSNTRTLYVYNAGWVYLGQFSYVPDATTTTKGTIQLDGGTATSPTVHDSNNLGGQPPSHYATNTVFGASGASHSQGLVPDPGATVGTSKFLCEDGTWKNNISLNNGAFTGTFQSGPAATGSIGCRFSRSDSYSYTGTYRYLSVGGEGTGSSTGQSYWSMEVDNRILLHSEIDAISDRRAKTDIETLDENDAFNKVMSLRAVSYVWNDGREDKRTKLGWIAQEVGEAGIGEAITVGALGQINGELVEDYHVLNKDQLIAVLWAAVRSLGERVEQLEKSPNAN